MKFVICACGGGCDDSPADVLAELWVKMLGATDEASDEYVLTAPYTVVWSERPDELAGCDRPPRAGVRMKSTGAIQESSSSSCA